MRYNSSFFRRGLASSKIMYHGTGTGKNNRILNGILENGLLDPRQECFKNETCEGVHLAATVAQTLYYSDMSSNTYGGNQLFVVVRADLAKEALPDFDMASAALELRRSYQYFVEDIDDLSSFLGTTPRENLSGASVAAKLRKHAVYLAKSFLADQLEQYQLTDYSRPLYRYTLNDLTQRLYVKLLEVMAENFVSSTLGFASYEKKSPDFLGAFLRDLSNASRDVHRASTGSSGTVGYVLKVFDQGFLMPYADAAYFTPEAMRLFLLSPKFKSSGSIDVDAGITVRFKDPIGYEGRTRIVGIVELLTLHDLVPTEAVQEKSCKGLVPYFNVPVAHIHYGAGSSATKSALMSLREIAVGKKTLYRQLLGKSLGLAERASSDGNWYGKISAAQMCSIASFHLGDL